MNVLTRVTTEFIDIEDRIRISGEQLDGDTDVLWLTQRLMNRLTAHLCQWLERQLTLASAAPAVQAAQQDVMQGFAQQAARAHLPSQPPVRACASNTGWRVDSIDVTQANGAVVLTFKGEGARQTQLTLPAQALRQWLGIVYQQYQRGGWPMDVWPPWMEAGSPVSGEPRAVVMH